MNAFLDTNIIIDFFDSRRQYHRPAAIIFDLAYRKAFTVSASALTFVNAYYILRHEFSREELYVKLRALASYCDISPIDKEIIVLCLQRGMKDFEDDVQWQSSKRVDADLIITRNPKDFKDFECQFISPEEFLDDYFAGKEG